MATPPNAVTSQTAVREMGYVVADTSAQGSGTWWSSTVDEAEQTPELRWPDSIATFDRMRRQDTQIQSVIFAVTLPVRRAPWRIDPNGARPEVVRLVAEDLGLQVQGAPEAPTGRRRGRFSWDEHVRLALTSLVFGHAVFEQVYRIDEQTGQARLRKLGFRPQKTITTWNVSRDGGLDSIEQDPSGGRGKKVIMPVTRLVVYSRDREGGDWWGRSILRPAYGPWVIRDRLLRVGAQSVERNGLGIPTYVGPPEGTQDHIDAGWDIVTDLRAGDNTGASIPNGASLSLMGVSGQVVDALPWVKYYDDAIAKSVLAHVLSLGGRAGSYALGVTFENIFTKSLQSIGDEIADIATQHIVEDLVDINFGPDETAPRIVCGEIGGETAALAQAVQTLVAAGVVSADDSLEAHLRTGLGLPAADGTAERGGATPPAPPAPPDPTGQDPAQTDPPVEGP